MIPTKEMLNAYFDELAHDNIDNERVWFWAGIAAYTHLQSPASEEWRSQHGFNEKGDNDETAE